MATGFASAVAEEILDALFNGSSPSILPVTAVFAQLHTGDPGAAGTSNTATESTRVQISMAAASGGTITSDSDATWEDVAAQETYTHVSLWDASTDGNFLASGTITANEVDAGDDFTLPAGDIDASIPVAS